MMRRFVDWLIKIFGSNKVDALRKDLNFYRLKAEDCRKFKEMCDVLESDAKAHEEQYRAELTRVTTLAEQGLRTQVEYDLLKIEYGKMELQSREKINRCEREIGDLQRKLREIAHIVSHDGIRAIRTGASQSSSSVRAL
jgi:hypothetical protein